MNSKKTKRLLSFVICVIIAVACVAGVYNGIAVATVGNKQFYEKGIATQTVADECNKQLNQKYKALAVKSNLPLDVFYSVTVKFNTQESLLQSAQALFDENDSLLRNGSRYGYFADTIKEYAKANSLSLTKEEIDLTSREAEQIYCDTVGIHGLEYLEDAVAQKREGATRNLSFCVLTAMIAVALLAILHKNDGHRLLSYASVGIMTGGLAGLISFVSMLVFGLYGKITIEPQAMSLAFEAMQRQVLLYSSIASLGILFVGIRALLNSNYDIPDIAEEFDGWIFSHAGFSKTWVDTYFKKQLHVCLDKLPEEGMVIEILKRAHNTFVGKLQVEKDFAFLICDSKVFYHDIIIPKNKLKKGKTGDKALVKIITWPSEDNKNILGEVVDILGVTGDNNTEMHAILAQYGLPYKYPKHVEDAANKISAVS